MRTRRWTDQRAKQAVAEACAALELPPASATLVHVGSAVSFRVGDLAVRICPLGVESESAALELALAAELQAQNVPTLEPFAPAPLRLPSGQVATLWHYLAHDPSAQVPAKAFGRLLKRFHQALELSQLQLPALDPVKVIERRLDLVEHAGVVAQDDVDMLRTRAEAVAKRLKRVDSPLGVSVLHGDAHSGNVVVGSLGPVLSDFEHACRGPREWDLVPTALRLERFGLQERDWDAFCAGYGYDVRLWSGYRAALAARGLLETLRALVDYQRCRREAEARLRYWRSARPSAQAPLWQPL